MYQSILVPLDGSEYSERALAAALDLAKMAGARLTLLTVVLSYKDAHVPRVERIERQVQERAEAYLAPFAERVRSSDVEVTAQVAHGEPAGEIILAAREAGADLIVMSTHGIGATGRHALGSVAMKVLQESHCPVLMVRIAEARPA